jgi:hypothetical protein
MIAKRKIKNNKRYIKKQKGSYHPYNTKMMKLISSSPLHLSFKRAHQIKLSRIFIMIDSSPKFQKFTITIKKSNNKMIMLLLACKIKTKKNFIHKIRIKKIKKMNNKDIKVSLK